MRDQALYTLHQYNQHLQMNAQMQALAKAQALLVNNKQLQQIRYLQQPQQAFLQNEGLYDQKLNLVHNDFSQIKLTDSKEKVEKSAPIDLETQIKLMMNYFTKKFKKSLRKEPNTAIHKSPYKFSTSSPKNILLPAAVKKTCSDLFFVKLSLFLEIA